MLTLIEKGKSALTSREERIKEKKKIKDIEILMLQIYTTLQSIYYKLKD